MRVRIAALLCLLAANVANATDGPSVSNWSGFYLGIDGGYGFGQQPLSGSCIPANLCLAPILSGMTLGGYDVGGHAGYNFQHGIWLGGVEADFGTSGITGSSSATLSVPGFTTTTLSQSDAFDYLASGRVRIGVLPFETVLIYGTGGIAWTRVSISTSTTTLFPPGACPICVSTATAPTSLLGWVAGGGVEASLARFGAPNVLLRLEDLFYDFGTQGSSSSTCSPVPSCGAISTSSSGALIVNVVRAGLSVKF